jgi:FKBP-type peptidyl-prolyl cis-trans isomerase SlyD
MQIAKNSVVEFDFSLVDEDGAMVADTEMQSTAILHGQRNVILGIERALEGHEAGDAFTVTVAPEEGYGALRDNFTRRVSKKYFLYPKRLQKGAVTHIRSGQGTQPVTVLKIGSKFVDVDLNHPHAGQTLRFDIKVSSVRQATHEEIAHGHAHGQHGAHH